MLTAIGMLPSMSRWMVTLLLLLACASHAASARTLQARIDRVTTAVATLDAVQLRLEWPADAAQGQLTLTAGTVDAPDLGYHYRNLTWTCQLRREAGHWRCDGTLRSEKGKPLQLAIDLDEATTHASLRHGNAVLEVDRSAATPDETGIDLTRVPLLWTQALLSRAWESGRFKSGTLDGHLRVHVPAAQPLQVTGTLAVAGAAFETPDATMAGENLGGAFAIDYRKTSRRTQVTVDGPLRGGEFLVGNAYVALPATPVGLHVEASQDLGAGWQLPVIAWHDGSTLVAQGSAAFDAQTNLQALDLHLHSADVSPLAARYLSGWLAVAGLADLKLTGAIDADARIGKGQLQSAKIALHGVDMADAKGRFRFDRLDGNVAFSSAAPTSSALHWNGGQVYDLDFGAASLPIASGGGDLRLGAPVSVPALGGSLRFESMTLRPPMADAGADIRFGLTVEKLDIGRLAKAFGWPAFQGQLSGRIPNARYANERLQFDGGLTLQVFGGTVQASALAMERPFGVAPSLTADLVLDDIDLQSLTGVFDFGSITGRLAGRIDALRLVDWTATAFDAELHTVKTRGVKQRISQRAVQNISSVGDASFASTLQSQLIGLFDDFGYSRIGISCRLENEVCTMGGLGEADTSGSEAGGFTIVEGAGIPRLTVVGFHRRVDWPTLVERLAAATSGDVKPVVE
jgi:hypothetical protein